jgi:hypothetical protein
MAEPPARCRCSAAMPRDTALSSTTSAVRPRRPVSSGAAAVEMPSGRPKQALKPKTLPAPGRLRTPIRPPIMWTSCADTASPRPVPP